MCPKLYDYLVSLLGLELMSISKNCSPSLCHTAFEFPQLSRDNMSLQTYKLYYVDAVLFRCHRLFTEILVHKEIIKITIIEDLKFVPVTFMQINLLHSKTAVTFFFSKIFIYFH